MSVVIGRSGRHRKPPEVPYVPGPERFNPPVQEYKPHVPALDVVAKRTQMDMLLNDANAAPGLREQVYVLLDKIVTDPANAEALGELHFLQTHLSATAQDNKAREARPVPLAGHDRAVAEQVLAEQLNYPHGHDAEAIAALRSALAIGEPAVQAATQPAPVQAAAGQDTLDSATLAVQNMAELANHR